MRRREPYRETAGPRPPAGGPRPGDGRYGRRASGGPGGHGGTGGVAGRLTMAKTGYALSCVLAALILVSSGLSVFIVNGVASIGGSHAITSGPSIGPQNILLMGLESRRDWDGNILPGNILKALHAGSAQGVANGIGGNDTNTLILVHIPAGGKKAVGFSIPRDDWVHFAGTVGPQQQGKIDQAYGVSMLYEQQKLRQQDPAISQHQIAFQGNEAGRTAAVATVEKLTGVHIDHFAEVNLDGFYELAKVLGGANVCLKHAVTDPYSGADFRAGYQHVDASQALAFVRQRHGLTNGDLDRTHRQQAFLDSVMYQLRSQGVLGDLSKLRALLSVGRRYVITDSGWDLLDFATEMRGLTSGNLVFRTLPIQGYAMIDGQDANQVNPASIKSIVQSAFSPRPARPAPVHRKTATAPPAGSTQHATVDVFNGGGTPGLAAAVSAALAKAGYRAGEVGNTAYRSTTAVLYGTGAESSAGKIAALFGGAPEASTSVQAGHVEVLLGAGATVPSGTAAVSRPSPAPRASQPAPSTGAQGGAVSGGGKDSVNGIPCVN